SAEEEAVPAATEIGTAAARRPGWPVRIDTWLGFGLTGVIALIAAILLLFLTGRGRRFVAASIRAFAFENGMRIAVGRIGGSLYGEMVLRDLSIRDPKGEFLFAPEMHVDWRPFAFLGNHVDIRSATARRMILRRLPEFRETPPSDEPLLP